MASSSGSSWVLCGTLGHGEVTGAATIADGVDQVLRAAREQLLGASQLKVMAGGGIASPYDPIDVTQSTEAELRAAVEDWGTYIMVHAYTPRAISRPSGPGCAASSTATWPTTRPPS